MNRVINRGTEPISRGETNNFERTFQILHIFSVGKATTDPCNNKAHIRNVYLCFLLMIHFIHQIPLNYD